MTDNARADTELQVRWLGVLSLITSAEQLVGRGGGVWPALSIVSADAAIEALLGMVAVPTDDKEQFQQLYDRARQALRQIGSDLPPGLDVRIQTAHRFRNTGLHLGSEVPRSIARNAIRTARDLRGFVRSQAGPLRLVDDTGLIPAIGRMSGVKAIEDALVKADEALHANAWKEALDQAALALDSATGRLDPRIEPDTFVPNMRVYGDRDRRLPDLKEWIDRRFDHHEEWMVAMAMGLHPVEYRDLLGSAGRVIFYMDGHYDVHRSIEPSAESAEATVHAVADAIYRLTQLGAIRLKERWE